VNPQPFSGFRETAPPISAVGRSTAERTTEEDTKLRHTSSTISSMCCIDRLNPQPEADIRIGLWNHGAKRLGALEVDDQFNLRAPSDRKFGGFCTTKDAVDVIGARDLIRRPLGCS